METDKRKRNIVTVAIAILFLLFSYLIIKSFFKDISFNNTYIKNDKFSFIYDTSILDDEMLNKMYDRNRTNKVVMDSNYADETDDINKGKLLLKPSKMEYYSNGYKLSIKNKDYLNLYRLSDNSFYVAILGSDFKYYTVKVSINSNLGNIDKNNKEWVESKSNKLVIYNNSLYKVINDNYNIKIDLPSLINGEKYSDKELSKLTSTIKDIISVDEIEYNKDKYYDLGLNNIKLDDKCTLLLKDSKIKQFDSIDDITNDLSYTYIVLLDGTTINEIDDINIYNSLIKEQGVNKAKYNYKGYNTYILSNNTIILEIGDSYFLINNPNKVLTDDSSIDNYLDGILIIE